jgi:hypothetical protein
MTSSVIAPRCTRLAPGDRGGPIDERGLTDLRARARQRVRTVLAAVPVPRPWSMNAWVDGLEAWRGREIDLVPVEYRPGRPSGAWQARPDYDLIAYVEHTSALHQDHIIAHELAHMLCAHTGTCQMSESEAAQLAPDLAPQALSADPGDDRHRRVRGRADRGAADERGDERTTRRSAGRVRPGGGSG